LHNAADDVWRDPLAHGRVDLLESAGKWEEDVVFAHREGVSAALEVVVPGMVKI